MKFSDYWDGLPREAREAFATKVGTKPIYLTQIAGKHRRAGPKLAQRIALATKNRVSFAELRPDIFEVAA